MLLWSGFVVAICNGMLAHCFRSCSARRRSSMVGLADGSSVAAWADVALGLSDSCASQYSIAEICEITMVMQSKVLEYFPR